MKLLNKVVYLKDLGILVVADLHIGYEEALNKMGILLPRSQFKEMKKEFSLIFSKIKGKLKEIIILGDLKHEFGTISQQEWEETGYLLDYFAEKAERIILIKGNHDNILEPIAHKRKLEIVDYYVLGDMLFCHGHKNLKKYLRMKKIKKIFLGHRHPAVSLKEGRKEEIFKCFLVGKRMGKEVYVLPSFFPRTVGSDIINWKRKDLRKSFIKHGINTIHQPKTVDEESYDMLDFSNFEVFIIGDKVYDFGVLSGLRKLSEIFNF